MIRRALELHRDFTCAAAAAIEVEIDLAPSGLLRLGYRVTGDLTRLRLPPPAPPERTDDLWKTTCFEAFIEPSDGPGYYEFNLSPSGAWATYGFTSPRQGMRPALEIPAPHIETRAAAAGFDLGAVVELPPGAFPTDRPWRVALTAVIEDTRGAKAYWALAYPSGPPDFHNPDGRMLDLTASEQT
jgi:hypothetical protein